MIKQDDLILGLSFYQKHEYIPALKHFSKGANQQNNEISKMIYESLEAVTNMQMCNYNAAGEQLNRLKLRLQNWEMHPGQNERSAQIELLKIKVLANLMIIYLVNCKGEQLENVLSDLFASIQDRYSQNKVVGASLFKALLKSLFGFESFGRMQGELFSALSKFDSSESPRFKQLRNGSTLQSPIMLSSLSIYSHLTGNISDALKLQKVAYQMTRQQNAVAAIISLRHLQQLEKEAGNQRQKRSYRQQLMAMMNSQELQGIPDQTLFRNYSEKIKLANKIIKKLSELEKRLVVKQNNEEFSRKAVIWKLKFMQDQNNQEKIGAVIGLIQKDYSVLNVMAEAEFINDAIEEYQKQIKQFLSMIGQFQIDKKINLMRGCLQTIKSFQRKKKLAVNKIVKQQSESQSDKEVIQEVSKNQKQITYSRVKKDNQGLPPKIIQTFRSETQRRPQKHSPSPINSSRIETKPISNSKMVDRKHIYLNQAEQQKPKYRIGKDDVKKASKIQKGRETRQAIQTKQKIKTELSPKQQQHIQKNPMKQFMRNVIPAAKSKVSEAPILLVRQQKKKKQEQIQESEAANIPILQKDQITNRIPKPPVMNPSNQQNSSSEVKKSKQLFTGSGKSMIPKSSFKDNYNQRLQIKIKKCINMCIAGQYIEKRHFSSDGGAQRFLKLGTHKDKLFWGQDQDHFDQSSYNVQDIKGIVMGKVTETMLKESNKKLQPWKCFSLILKKRTFDVFCPQQKDLKFWIPGLSLFLKDLKLDHKRYMVKSAAAKKIEKHSHKSIVIGENVITRYYSTGRVLWKKFLMRMQWQFLASKKKQKRNSFSNANAYAIVVGAVRLMSYVPTKIKRNVQ